MRTFTMLVACCSLSLKCGGSEYESVYLKDFTAPENPTNIAEFKISSTLMPQITAGDAHAVLGSCLILSCSVSRFNGITFYLPEPSVYPDHFKAPTSKLIVVKSVKDLSLLIERNKGKVCLLWAGKSAPFADVLALAEEMNRRNVAFYFGVKDDLESEVRVDFF